MTAAPFDLPLLALGSRLDELRASLMYHEALGSHPRATELTRTSRAWAYVAMAAALEAFVGAFIDEMASRINAAGLAVRDLDLGVVSLIEAGGFDAAAAGRKQPMWQRRSAILRGSASPAIVVVPAGLRPLDGRTIKQAHLESLWAIYGLPGGPTPSPLHGLALERLSGRPQRCGPRQRRSAEVRFYEDLCRRDATARAGGRHRDPRRIGRRYLRR